MNHTITTIRKAIQITGAVLLSLAPISCQQKKPKETVPVSQWEVSCADIASFLNEVIPNLYLSEQGEAPGLPKLKGLVNDEILHQQELAFGNSRVFLQKAGVTASAKMTNINPKSVRINREKGYIYAEATGTGTISSTQGKSSHSDIQWRVLLYILEHSDTQVSWTPAGEMHGNPRGLFLQQIEEQPVGTVNSDNR